MALDVKAVFACLLFFCTSTGVWAQTRWLPPSGNWNEASNWSNGIPNAAGQSVQFGNLEREGLEVTLESDVTVGSLLFDAGTSARLVGGVTLTFDDPLSELINVTSPSLVAELNPIIAWNAQETLQLQTVLRSQIVFQQPFAESSGNLLAEGAGTVRLTRPNPNWAGQITVDGGTLEVATAGALGVSSAVARVTVNPDGRLLLIENVTNDSIQLAGGQLEVMLQGNHVRTELNAPVSLSADSRLTGPQQLVAPDTLGYLSVTGEISGVGGLSVGGQVDFDGANSFSGPLSIENDAFLILKHAQGLGQTPSITINQDGYFGSLFDISVPIRLNGGGLASLPKTTSVDQIELVGTGTIGRNWSVNSISGEGDLILYSANNAAPYLKNNTYTGATFIEDGNVNMYEPWIFGSADTGTVIREGATVFLYVPTAEPFELDGGHLYFANAESIDYAGTILSQGGSIQTFDEQQVIPHPIQLLSGVTTISTGTFTGGTTGTGDVVVSNIRPGALNHIGNTTFARQSSEQFIELPNGYTGDTIVSERTQLILRNPAGFGVGDSPIIVKNEGKLRLETILDRSVHLIQGEFEIPAGIEYDQPIHVGYSSGYASGIRVDGLNASPIQMDEDTNLYLRKGSFAGPIQGAGTLTILPQDGDDVQLQGDSDYTGATYIHGPTRLRHANGLGSAERGTVVTGWQAVLDVNVTTAEPLSVADYGHINVNASLPHVPTVASNWLQLSNDPQQPANTVVKLGQDGTFGGLTSLEQGTLQIDADVNLHQLYLERNGGLRVASNGSLTTPNEIVARSGQIDVTGELNAPALRKLSNETMTLYSLGSYDGEFYIEQGIVIADPITPSGENRDANQLFGTNAGGTHIGQNASVVMRYEGSITEPIYLENSSGTGFFGALHLSDQINVLPILDGPLHVGDVGSTVSGNGILRGPISGGSLRTQNGMMFLQGNQQEWTGSLVVGDRSSVAFDAGSSFAMLGEVTVEAGGQLYLNRDHQDRIHDTATITMDGGQLAAGGSGDETMGQLRIANGYSKVAIYDAGALTFDSLTRTGDGIVHFEAGDAKPIHMNNNPALQNGIVGPWAIVNYQGNFGNSFGFATIGPNGIQTLDDPENRLRFAEATDNVVLDSNVDQTPTKDVTVNSLATDRTLNLAGHLLTVQSGGVIGRTRNGRITSGTNELLLYGGTEADIVDGAAGAVDVTVLGNGALLGNNTHSGVTRLLASDSSQMDLGQNAIPVGGDLVAYNVRVRRTNDARGDLVLGRLEVDGSSRVELGRTQVSELELHQGEVELDLFGDGVVRKQGSRDAILTGRMNDFVGSVEVNDGRLELNSDAPTVRINNGTLRLNGWNGPSTTTAAVTLSGGTLEFAASRHTGPITVEQPSTILTGSETRLAADILHGSSALTLTGTGNLAIEGQQSTFVGSTLVKSGTVEVAAEDSLPGEVTLGANGTLRVTTYGGQMVESSLPPIRLDGGRLILLPGLGEDFRFSRSIAVDSASSLGATYGFSSITIDSDVHMLDESLLMLSGTGHLDFAGSLEVQGNVTIDARPRHLEPGAPLGSVRFSGPILASAPNSVLNLVSVGVNLDASFTIPAGNDLQVFVNGQDVALLIDHADETIGGNGSVDNDVLIGNEGELQPGSSVGVLSLNRSLVLDGNGVYEWELGTSASDPDQVVADLVQVAGSVSVTADSTAPFVIQVVGLASDGHTEGQVSAFDSNRSQVWPMVATASLEGFDQEDFVLDVRRFVEGNSLADDGYFRLSRRSGGLFTSYVVPAEIDSLADPAVRSQWVQEIVGTWFGDANLDGVFDSTDLIQIFQSAEYEDQIVGNSTWAEGDWNGDGDFDSSDLILAFQDGGYEQGNRFAIDSGAVSVVPEPTSTVGFLLAFGLLSVLSRRRHCR